MLMVMTRMVWQVVPEVPERTAVVVAKDFQVGRQGMAARVLRVVWAIWERPEMRAAAARPAGTERTEPQVRSGKPVAPALRALRA